MKRLFTRLSPVVASLSLLPYVAHAQFGGALDKVQNTAGAAGYDKNPNLLVTIGNLVKILLGLSGVICVLLIIYAGFLWMTAQGESKNVSKAKDIIRNCIIGLVIITLAYAITAFVFSRLGCAAGASNCGT